MPRSSAVTLIRLPGASGDGVGLAMRFLFDAGGPEPPGDQHGQDRETEGGEQIGVTGRDDECGLRGLGQLRREITSETAESRRFRTK